MSDVNNLIEFYKKHFPSRFAQFGDEDIDGILEEIYPVYNKEDAVKTKNDLQFIEKELIKQIMLLEKEVITPKYLSLYARKLSSKVIDADTPIVIFDELLQYTLTSFYMLIYSLMCNKSKEHFERCFKSCVVILDLQGNKKEIGYYNFEDLVKICKLPTDIMNLAMDTYWVSWTFVFCHEIYHIKNVENSYSTQDELEADKYAYNALIKLIEKQKNGEIPQQLEVFYEYLYLAPLMLLEYFKLLDFYNSLFGKKAHYTNHPSPEVRQENLLNMYDEYIPDDFDTQKGNDIFNCFLDEIDILKEQLEIKIRKGKLDFLNNN